MTLTEFIIGYLFIGLIIAAAVTAYSELTMDALQRHLYGSTTILGFMIGALLWPIIILALIIASIDRR